MVPVSRYRIKGMKGIICIKGKKKKYFTLFIYAFPQYFQYNIKKNVMFFYSCVCYV